MNNMGVKVNEGNAKQVNYRETTVVSYDDGSILTTERITYRNVKDTEGFIKILQELPDGWNVADISGYRSYGILDEEGGLVGKLDKDEKHVGLDITLRLTKKGIA